MAAPQFEFSDELVALFGRAERAEAQARRLCDENDRWRHSVRQQLNYMLELGGEFKTAADRGSPGSQKNGSLCR
jgi:hypothetical protein